MMKIEFSTSGAAFGNEYLTKSENEWIMIDEVSRILKRIIDEVDGFEKHGPIMDINGNKIGEWSLD